MNNTEINSATQQDADEYIQQLQKIKHELCDKDAMVIAVINSVIDDVRMNPDHLKILPAPKSTADDWKKYAEAHQSRIASGHDWIICDTKQSYQKDGVLSKKKV